MTELSPAAKAVQATVDAMYRDWGNMMPSSSDAIAAAALQAVADQVVPNDGVASSIERIVEKRIRDELLAIAAELKAQ